MDGTTSIRLKFQTSLFVTSNLMTVQLCAAVVDSLLFMFLDPGCNDRPQSLEAYVTLPLVVRVENLYHIVLNTTWRTLSELCCRVVWTTPTTNLIQQREKFSRPSIKKKKLSRVPHAVECEIRNNSTLDLTSISWEGSSLRSLWKLSHLLK